MKDLRGKGVANASFGITGLALVAAGACWLLVRPKDGAIVLVIALTCLLAGIVALPFMWLWRSGSTRWWLASLTGIMLVLNLIWWPMRFYEVKDTSSTAGLLMMYWIPLAYCIIGFAALFERALDAVATYMSGDPTNWSLIPLANRRWATVGCVLAGVAGAVVWVMFAVQEASGGEAIIMFGVFALLIAIAVAIPALGLLAEGRPTRKGVVHAVGVLFATNVVVSLGLLIFGKEDIRGLGLLSLCLGGIVILTLGFLADHWMGRTRGTH